MKKHCKFCNKEFKPHTPTTVFCSRRCVGQNQSNELVRQWLNGESSGSRADGGCGVFVRKYLLSLHGEQCWECGWDKRNPVTQRVPLEIDHIDGEWRNNRPSNLRLLCPNCHSLTPTYRALNKGNGRNYRKIKHSKRNTTIPHSCINCGKETKNNYTCSNRCRAITQRKINWDEVDIPDVLHRNKNNLTHASKELGISIPLLKQQMKKLNITIEPYYYQRVTLRGN